MENVREHRKTKIAGYRCFPLWFNKYAAKAYTSYILMTLEDCCDHCNHQFLSLLWQGSSPNYRGNSCSLFTNENWLKQYIFLPLQGGPPDWLLSGTCWLKSRVNCTRYLSNFLISHSVHAKYELWKWVWVVLGTRVSVVAEMPLECADPGMAASLHQIKFLFLFGGKCAACCC